MKRIHNCLLNFHHKGRFLKVKNSIMCNQLKKENIFRGTEKYKEWKCILLKESDFVLNLIISKWGGKGQTNKNINNL